jgi:hypothetical protein
MTSPESDPKEDRISEMVRRARAVLTTYGTWTGNGVHYYRGHGLSIVEDAVRTFSIDIVAENVGSYGSVYMKQAGSKTARVEGRNVPQAVHILRQIMVLDDLARA